MRLPRALAAVVCVVLVASGCPRRVPGSEVFEEDARPALWLDQAGQGRKWTPSALEGQVTVVNFFATWCFPCLGQLLLLGKIQKDLGPRGLRVVAVGMDLEGGKVLDPFVRAEPRPFPVLIADEAIRKGETPFGKIPVVPSTFLIDREGRIVQAWAGLPNPDELRAAVEERL